MAITYAYRYNEVGRMGASNTHSALTTSTLLQKGPLMATRNSSGHPLLIDLTGQQFGAWIALRRDDGRPYTAKRKVTYWICRCECGTIRTLKSYALRSGETTSCGCGFRGVDLAGQRFGRLLVISRRPSKRGRVFWICQCDCGKTKTVEAYSLRHGHTSSCGCLHRERTSAKNRKHGKVGTPEYNSWAQIISRCTNPKSHAYHNYGGRGIYICERWRNSSVAFMEDMGPVPTPEHSIDRIDNNGSYTCGKCPQCLERGAPANCRWATRFEQSCNRRTNRLLTHEGETLTVREWCLRTGLKRSTIEVRLRLGWPIGRILTTPLRPQKARPIK